MTRAPVAPPPAPACSACRRNPERVNEWFECSHVECPNRRRITAAPRDRVPPSDD